MRASLAALATRSAISLGASPATWLSFTSMASKSPMRWLVPPPQRTAHFSSMRMPGMVLRVSQMAARVPAVRST